MYDTVHRKITCPSCNRNCMMTFEVSVYQDVRVGRELEEKGEGVLVARHARAKASTDLMSTILHQSEEYAFRCAS